MAAIPEPMEPTAPADAWPRTRRPLPWLIAGFLATIFLVPIEAIHLSIPLPISSDFDRFVIVLIIATWAIGGFIGKGESFARFRPRGWAAAMIVYVFLAVASIAVNVGRITNLGELSVAEKRLALLLALVAFFSIASLTLRVSELRPFSALIACLAVLTAVGTIYEKETNYNVFYSTATSVLSPVATVDPSPTEAEPDVNSGRPNITGPTRHPLSVTSLLGMALPFAVVLAAIAPTLMRRLLWGLAACVIITGALMTQRRSGTVVPAFALLALFVLRPRQLLRLAPFGIAAIVVALALTPSAFSTFQELERPDVQASTKGRTSDYPAIVPDLLTHPILGRGYGTLDSLRTDTYRILDNEYLGQAYQVGFLGLIVFLSVILTPLIIVRSVLRSDNPMRGPPALAAGAGCLAFGVASALYDIFTFPQAPYLFVVLAAMCTCAASVEVPLRRESEDPQTGELLVKRVRPA